MDVEGRRLDLGGIGRGQRGGFGDVAVLVRAVDRQDGPVTVAEEHEVGFRFAHLREACDCEEGEDVGEADAVDQAASCFGEPDRGRTGKPRR